MSISVQCSVSGEIVVSPVTANPGIFMVESVPASIDFTIQIKENTSAIQDAISANLEDILLREGGGAETRAHHRKQESNRKR